MSARPTARAARAAAPGDPGPAGRVALAWQDRHLRRKVIALAPGDAGAGMSDVLIDLPEPAELSGGDRLILEDGRHLEVVAAPEPLAEVRGASLPRLAWHIGNRHTPCQVDGARLLIRRDHVLEDMLARLGAEVAHVEAPFQPEGGAYGHGRTHGHSHSHDPHHDPNAHIPHRARDAG